MKETVQMHTKCPKCGSERGIIKEYMAKMRAEGKISKNAFPTNAGSWQFMLLDPVKLSLLVGKQNVPMITPRFDICAETNCWTIYPVNVEYSEQLVDTGMFAGMVAPKP
jgi:hypothetical protein